VVDDDPILCETIADALNRNGYEVTAKTNAGDALSELEAHEPACVITDICLGERSGLELCERAAALWPEVPVILMTAYASVDKTVHALRLGAHDFLTKPVDLELLDRSLKRALSQRALHQELGSLQSEGAREDEHGLVGECAGIQRIFELIQQMRQTTASVLICGESGTGKELVARAIHARSSHQGGPFVAVNCAAIPSTLLESELFGHVRGAFTDAKNSHSGLLAQADGGTLFLDEISEMPLEMQAKLLRALQERRVRPVGGNTEIPFDTRLLAATNRDLEREVSRGRFREDLFYRINVICIQLPPLRARGNDILLLAQRFIRRFASQIGKNVHGISAASAQRLLEYDWPGNVRELENTIERAVTLAKHTEIGVGDLPDRIRTFHTPPVTESDFRELLPLEEIERRYIYRVLRAAKGNKTHAARILGLDRRTLYRRLERYEPQGSPPPTA
jgi:two-component system response regulator HydG